MNITQAPEQTEPTTQEQEEKRSPRAHIITRIREERMPQATKKFANRLLAENHNVGSIFSLSMGKLRKLRHAATNLEVVKCLARLRRVGLIAYEINQTTQVVSIRFLVK